MKLYRIIHNSRLASDLAPAYWNEDRADWGVKAEATVFELHGMPDEDLLPDEVCRWEEFTPEFRLTEDQVVEVIRKQLQEIDADALARALGELIGGRCFTDGNTYAFVPDANYMGALNHLKSNA